MVRVNGLDELASAASDASGNCSHGGLLAWLESRGLGLLEDHDRHVLLADLDPNHTGKRKTTQTKNRKWKRKRTWTA